MSTLKIKDIEGEAEDIQRLFHNEGRNLSSYLNMDRISNWWIFGGAFAFFILSCCIWTHLFTSDWNKVAIQGIFLLGFSVVAVVHYNYKNWVITLIAIVAGLAMNSMTFEVKTPQDAIRNIEQITTKHLGGNTN